MPIAIIPAKKISRRLPKKNFRNFFGKPIIFWSINFLKKTKIFDKIVVSTDSDEIKKIAKKNRVDFIIDRPTKLCKDNVTTIEVIKHAINHLQTRNIKSKYFCCMYPAAPNTNYKDIILGFKLIKKIKSGFIFPCTKKNNQKNKKLSIEVIKNIKKKTINNHFKDSGQFYFASSRTWLSSKKIIKLNSRIIPICSKGSIDINSYNDFMKAKKIFKNEK